MCIHSEVSSNIYVTELVIVAVTSETYTSEVLCPSLGRDTSWPCVSSFVLASNPLRQLACHRLSETSHRALWHGQRWGPQQMRLYACVCVCVCVHALGTGRDPWRVYSCFFSDVVCHMLFGSGLPNWNRHDRMAHDVCSPIQLAMRWGTTGACDRILPGLNKRWCHVTGSLRHSSLSIYIWVSLLLERWFSWLLVLLLNISSTINSIHRRKGWLSVIPR
jgi:hypothetical protein